MAKITDKTMRMLETYEIRKSDSFGNYEIYSPEGRSKPDALSGVFTSVNTAQRCLDSYKALMGFEDEKRKILEEIKSITPIDYEEI